MCTESIHSSQSEPSLTVVPKRDVKRPADKGQSGIPKELYVFDKSDRGIALKPVSSRPHANRSHIGKIIGEDEILEYLRATGHKVIIDPSIPCTVSGGET